MITYRSPGDPYRTAAVSVHRITDLAALAADPL
jgi:hypothetical protein